MKHNKMPVIKQNLW